MVITGHIIASETRVAKRRYTLLELQDETGIVKLCFFYLNPKQKKQLVKGAQLRCFGQTQHWGNTLALVHPEYVLLDNKQSIAMDKHLTPIYPATEGLSQNLLRTLVQSALSLASKDNNLIELLPDTVRTDLHYPTLLEALTTVHHPPADSDVAQLSTGVHPAQQRLAFEELLAHQLHQRQLHQARRSLKAPHLSAYPDKTVAAFLKALDFTLTAAQQRVIEQISHDLAQPSPMFRLLQGDVGAGKTVVAAIALLQALDNGYQVALMAPTELLAEQHYRTFKAWFEPMQIPLTLLCGSLPQAEKKSATQCACNR